jgi:hypothetical protein
MLSLLVTVDFVIWFMPLVDVLSVSDISEVHLSSIFMTKIRRSAVLLFIYRFMF